MEPPTQLKLSVSHRPKADFKPCFLFLSLLLGLSAGPLPAMSESIRPSTETPFYWQMNGETVVLLGGSVEDNLLQIPNLEEHLDLLASVGGNYVRGSMSCRDEGNLWWFAQDPDTGLYDLNQLNEAYWARFEEFLHLTSERGIVVQIEVWDRFDFAREPWQLNPYNPKNNTNYTAEESGLVYETDNPGPGGNVIFQTVPALGNNTVVLPYQHKLVDRMLSISLRYGHVLYCMDNETDEAAAWGKYWSDTIKARAEEEGVTVMTTEMWNQHDLLHEEHLRTLDHPETYDFADISQNNHNYGHEHWTKPQEVRQHVIDSGRIRPLNSVKIYGQNARHYGTTRDAQERFWRNIIGGLASARFHRPPHGLGLNAIAQTNIRSMRMALAEHDIVHARPAEDCLRNRSLNEAYCSAIPGESYLVYFPDGGDVNLKVPKAGGRNLSVRWLDIRKSAWSGDATRIIERDGTVRIVTPTEEGYWAAVVKVGRTR